VPADLAVVVVHSGQSRTLAGTEYGDRRLSCEHAAARLGLRSLRDATFEQVSDDPLARHVVNENARVLEAATSLRDGDVAALGRLLLESHASLRDDYRVSTPELDALVHALMEAGALGARLTGAGFGGCVVAVTTAEPAREILDSAMARYQVASGRRPIGFVAHAADGAGRIDR
jgi:galactokinase